MKFYIVMLCIVTCIPCYSQSESSGKKTNSKPIKISKADILDLVVDVYKKIEEKKEKERQERVFNKFKTELDYKSLISGIEQHFCKEKVDVEILFTVDKNGYYVNDKITPDNMKGKKNILSIADEKSRFEIVLSKGNFEIIKNQFVMNSVFKKNFLGVVPPTIYQITPRLKIVFDRLKSNVYFIVDDKYYSVSSYNTGYMATVFFN